MVPKLILWLDSASIRALAGKYFMQNRWSQRNTYYTPCNVTSQFDKLRTSYTPDHTLVRVVKHVLKKHILFLFITFVMNIFTEVYFLQVGKIHFYPVYTLRYMHNTFNHRESAFGWGLPPEARYTIVPAISSGKCDSEYNHPITDGLVGYRVSLGIRAIVSW